MSLNHDIAACFDEMATLLVLTGANAFRVNAHTRVARALEDLASPVPNDAKQLQAIEGIGKSSAMKIIEFIETDEILELHTLRDKVPAGLTNVLRVPGLGPKTVRRLWIELGIESVADLKTALVDGRVAEMDRMGAKTVQNLAEAITFMESSGGRIRIGLATRISNGILQTLSDASQGAAAGSLRRGKETIGDIDVLVAGKDPRSLSASFEAMENVTKVIVSGETKTSVRLEDGVQADLRVVDEAAFGAALLYFTGSKEHNVRLRERAIAKGLRLNEYGLFSADDLDGEPIACATEEEIYAKLDLPFIPPELREDRGEFTQEIPQDLITVKAIRAELHAHTTASDGLLTIDGLALKAKAEGRKVIAVTDHSRSSAHAGGLSIEALLEHAAAVREANKRIKGITILAGSEVDIHKDGSLDYPDEILAELDVVVASPHAALRQDSEDATNRLVKAALHPLVNIIGHPTGRLINERRGLEPDMAKVFEAAIEGNTALEINANPYRLDLRDTHVRAASEAGALISINCDVHKETQFDYLAFGVATARRGWLTAQQCINTWEDDALFSWLDAKI